MAMLVFLLGLGLAKVHGAGAAGEHGVLSDEQVRQVLAFFAGEPTHLDETNRFEQVPDAAALGQALFFDTRLSLSDTVSCSSCHRADSNWVDGAVHSRGEGVGHRNAPTLWNVASRRWFFWDGRAATLWTQALKPMEAAAEMGGSRWRIAHLFANDTVLRNLYENAFGSLSFVPSCTEITDSVQKETCKIQWSVEVDRLFANVGKALAAFEATIAARNSPFDRYLDCLKESPPDKCSQLDRTAITGLSLFTGRAGCVNCHHGRDLTDEEFHNIMLPDANGRLDPDPGRMKGLAEAKADEFGPGGRYSDCPDCARAQLLNVTKESPEAFNSFKTPSLRQVAVTAPYMHNGIYADLRQVLMHYSTLHDAPVVGHHSEMLINKLNLAEEEIRSLIAFLCTLTSEEGQVMGRKVTIPNDPISRVQCAKQHAPKSPNPASPLDGWRRR